jgi:predicted ATPase with chaperone activity
MPVQESRERVQMAVKNARQSFPRQRITWIIILQHGLMNITLFGYVILGVMGWGG